MRHCEDTASWGQGAVRVEHCGDRVRWGRSIMALG